MKFLSKLLVLTLTFLMGITSIPVFASTSDNDTVYYEDSIITEQFIEPNLVGTTNITAPRNNYGESQVSTTLPTKNKTIYVTPTGQPKYGYQGGSGGRVFFFKSGGSSTTFTVTIDYKNVTFKAETGKSTSYGSGYGADVPRTAGNHRFQFKKNYIIKSKKIAVYKYGVYQYSYYVHDSGYSLGHRWIKA